jgi:hypothetical protein
MKPKLGVSGVLLLILSLVATSYATVSDQPYMQAARADLVKARTELQIARPNKGGHRANAIGLVNAAIAEVDSGIDFDRRHNHAQATVAEKSAKGTWAPDQPHMQAALDYLRSAKTNLNAATADKGGHRKKAIDHVKRAIDEVKKGMEVGG